ncbi:MAG TPA: peptidylprolyl isomerase [Bryobacteraceae bacterium]|nr:peptidylprolyl isomerase [Bryobacteraceae bacterium]
MKKYALLLATALAWGQTPAPPPANSADPVVLTIGNEKITQSQFEQIVATLPQQQREKVTTPAARKQVAEQLADLMTLAQAARAHKLDQTPAVKMRLELQDDQVLASAQYQSMGNGAADDATLHAFYDSHKKDWDQLTARHILIRFHGSQVPLKLGEKDLTEAEALQKAKDLRAKIVAGAKFADVAQAESDDVGSGANGGELGSFGRGAMVPEFENAAFSLPIGQVSQPVKSAYGYHLILVESRKTKSFEEAKPEIQQQIGPEQAKKGLEDLKKANPVVYNESYFGK